MSRYYAEKKDAPEVEVAYGIDGGSWFYQEFNQEGDCTVDLDSRFNKKFGRGELVKLLELTTAPTKHIKNVAIDLDPGSNRVFR